MLYFLVTYGFSPQAVTLLVYRLLDETKALTAVHEGWPGSYFLKSKRTLHELYDLFAANLPFGVTGPERGFALFPVTHDTTAIVVPPRDKKALDWLRDQLES